MNDSKVQKDLQGKEGTSKSPAFFSAEQAKSKSNAIDIPSINLPKGGGAIKGIDEKFSVNSVNGTASFSIPLPVSDARGFSPSLSLQYNSGSGNGICGMGWSINTPSIKRKTEKELPQYYDAWDSDTFILSDVDDLVAEFKKDDTGKFILNDDGTYQYNEFERNFFGIDYTIKSYLPRIEGLFSKIERWTEKNTGYIHWRTISRNNIISLYGFNKESRISDPLDDKKIFQWFLEFTFDDKGNCIYYQYKPENDEGLDLTRHHNKNRKDIDILYSNTYCKRILYGIKLPYKNKGEIFSQNPDDYLFETVFDYGEHDAVNPPFDEIQNWDFRSDAFSDYRAGFEIRTTRLCKRILHYHHFAELPGGSALVKSLDFTYNNNGIDGFTFLREVDSKGYIKLQNNDYRQKSFPPMSFDYQKHEWNTEIKSLPEESLINFPSGIDGRNYNFTDLFSEGLSGILTEQGGGWFYKSNLGEGNFTPAKLVAPKPSFSGLQQQLQLLELEANGIKQLVQWNDEPKGFFELRPDEEWRPFKPFTEIPNINQKDANTKLLDLNGDGIADLLITEQNVFTWYPSKGKTGFDSAKHTYHSFDEEEGPSMIFADGTQTIFLADMSGDGLTDIVRIRNAEVCYWPNLGFGKFGTKITMDNAPVLDFPDNFNPALIKFADIDGSGTSDIIYTGMDKFSIYLNQQGNSFSDEITIDPFPEINNSIKIDAVDLLGTGLTCITWNSPLPGHSSNPIRYIDIMNSRKPHLMTSYKNNFGKEVSLEYTPSTKFYIDAKLAGKPWVTKLHFPVQCITKTETRDIITGSLFVSNYKYGHGFYDHTEREFRGFGRVEQTDTEQFDNWAKGNASNVVDETLHQEPVLSKSWFHTGAFFNRNKILSQFEHEYWYEEMASQGFAVTANEFTLPDAGLIAATNLDPSIINSLTTDDFREAFRACKGMALRTEIFALDAPVLAPTDDEIKKQLTPFTVSTHNCIVELLQPKGQNKHAVFVSKDSEAITYNYERNTDDPRIVHTLNIKLDEFGNVLESASVAYPRALTDNTLPVETQNEQAKTLVTYIKNTYTNDVIGDDVRRLRLLAETKTYQLKGVHKSNQIFLPADFNNILGTSVEVDYHELDVNPAPGTSQKRLIENIRNSFYKNDLTGALPLNQLESIALPFENFQLASTPDLLNDIFGLLVDVPTMLEGKFIHSEGDSNWWIPSGTIQYIQGLETLTDAQNRFFRPVSYTDPFGGITTVKYFSNYFLLIEQTEDALSNISKVLSFNLRTLSPQRMLDANDNISEVLSDELGLAKAAALFGKGSEADDLTGLNEFSTFADEVLVNDFVTATTSTQLIATGKSLLQHATTRYVYDLQRFINSGGTEPVFVASIVREQHFQKNNDSPVQLSFEYSNGLGQVIMKKVQAEPGLAKQVTVNPDDSYTVTVIDTSLLIPPQLRWLGNGRAVLNNKGNPVKQFEPYFSVSQKFEDLKELVETGVTPLLFYDALSRLIKTEFPDETFSKVEFDTWKQVVFDQNDTVLDSQWYNKRFNRLIDAELTAEGKDPLKEQQAAAQTAKHANTPTTQHFDTLGRQILLVENNGKDGLNNDILFFTQAGLDIEGNHRSVTDARNNSVMQHKFDMLGNKVYQSGMDSGQRWLLLNVMGNPLRTWDERNHDFSFEYDVLHRPISKTVTGGDGLTPLNNMYEKIIYGENLPNDKLNNFRTKAVIIYDTVGKIETGQFDFKGNPLNTIRRFQTLYKDVADWNIINPDSKLELETFTNIIEYDALNRITKNTAPDSSIFLPQYDESGLLSQVQVAQNGNTEWFVKKINYNEKLQREKITYGNDITTNYFYDKETFRLIRLQTTRLNNDPLQDLYYTFDPVGNMTHLEDKNIPDVFFNNQKISAVATYIYDPLYRLIGATGREQIAQVTFGLEDNWNDLPFLNQYSQNDPMAWRNYTQDYQYDEVGNIKQMQHTAASGNWTRDYNYAAINNRLQSTTVGANTYNYSYHPQHGFLTSMPHLQVMNWNFLDELQAVARQKVIDGTPETTYYVYDKEGQRVRKITERQAGPGIDNPAKKSQRLYVGGIEIYREYDNADVMALERKTYKVMDDKRLIAMIDTRNDFDDGTAKRLVRYQFASHLGSAVIETDDAANVISYEEYHPFGTTSYQAVDKDIKAAAKRYRYTGKERDDETGFYYHGARYYVCWLGRWSAPDPIGIQDGVNLYAYVKNNPVMKVDVKGTDGGTTPPKQWALSPDPPGKQVYESTGDQLKKDAGSVAKAGLDVFSSSPQFEYLKKLYLDPELAKLGAGLSKDWDDPKSRAALITAGIFILLPTAGVLTGLSIKNPKLDVPIVGDFYLRQGIFALGSAALGAAQDKLFDEKFKLGFSYENKSGKDLYGLELKLGSKPTSLTLSGKAGAGYEGSVKLEHAETSTPKFSIEVAGKKDLTGASAFSATFKLDTKIAGVPFKFSGTGFAAPTTSTASPFDVKYDDKDKTLSVLPAITPLGKGAFFTAVGTF